MKRKVFSLIAVALFLAAIVPSCKDDDDNVAVTGVSLDKSTLALNIGESASLTATVTPNTATKKDVTWTSSTPAVATVVNGVVTAVSAGTATITVTTTDGDKTATCEVTVANVFVSVEGVTLNETTLTLTALGQSEPLEAIFTPADATNKGGEWSTSNDRVATVSTTGLVTATGPGTATITFTASEGSFKPACAVTVNLAPKPDRSTWTGIFNSHDDPNAPISNLFDGNPMTIWQTAATQFPAWFIVDMGAVCQITGFKLQLPEIVGQVWPDHIQFEISINNTDWQTVLDIEVLPKTTEEQTLPLAQTVLARYFKVTVHSIWDPSFAPLTNMGELDAY